MDKREIIELALLITLVITSISILYIEISNNSGNSNIYYLNNISDTGNNKIFDIDFSTPEDKLSVSPKNINILTSRKNNTIMIESPCGNRWAIFGQSGERTGSMDPVIDVNHTSIACPIGDYEIKKGDIVVFYRQGSSKMISHRVIDIINNSYHIKGDNSNQVEIVNKSSIKYYVIGVAY